jgi:xanthine dehydrogenase accessory factor
MEQSRLAEMLPAIRRLLSQGRPLVLATIISQQGSTPRALGAKMVIAADGSFSGTVGGGLMEASLLEQAPRLMAEDRAAIFAIDMSSEELAGADMICGGRVEVLMEAVAAAPETAALFDAAWEAVQGREKGLLITALDSEGPEHLSVRRGLLLEPDRWIGALPFSPEWIELLQGRIKQARQPELFERDGRRLWLEPLTPPGVLFLMGAGHISRAVAQKAVGLGFRLVVMDDRPDYARSDRFPDEAEVRVVPGFERCFENTSMPEDSFIVIVTRGHLFDRAVLGQALRTPAGYIGMIGSRRKRDAIYEALSAEGFSKQDLARVHCPIGLDIGAETPDEIAVSILAELIQDRAQTKP